MIITLVAFAVWAQPSFPPNSGCTVEYLFPCSFTTAIDASKPIKDASTTLSASQLIAEYRTGKWDVEGFEPVLFSDSKTLYGLTEVQTHPVVSDRVLDNVLSTLQTSSQDWLETEWGDEDQAATKFVYDVDLDEALNTAVFLRPTFADPWAGACDTTDFDAICAQWNLAISFAKTFYNLAKCSTSTWDSTVTQYQNGDFGVNGIYASVFTESGAPIGSNHNFTVLDSFPTGLDSPQMWTNYTNETWAYYLTFKRYDNAVFKVLAELTVPAQVDVCGHCGADAVDEVSEDITNIVDDSSKNETEKADEIADVLDDSDVTSVVIVNETGNEKTTITDAGVDTTTDSTDYDIPTQDEAPEPIWIRFDDGLGLLTHADDGSAIISIVYNGYTEVADGACNSHTNMACNTDAVPYYTSNVVLDLLNAGTNATAVDVVLASVSAGHYDKTNNYRPSIMSEAGINLAISSTDDELYNALKSSDVEPDFSQQRLQLAWIASAAEGQPQWVSLTLDGTPWEIYVQAVEDKVVMLGYRNTATNILTTAGNDAAGNTDGSDDSDNTTMYIIIAICVVVVLCIVITIISFFFCKPKKSNRMGESQMEITPGDVTVDKSDVLSE